MSKLPQCLLLLIAGTLCLAMPLDAASFRAATAQVEITGPAGYPMGGYSARKGVSQGTHDPLLAKILLLETGGRQVGLVVYDLVLFTSERVARQAREQLGIDLLLQVATHTHSGPIPKDLSKIDEDPWVRDVENKVLRALKEAQGRYVPARISVGQTRLLLGHNRRKVNSDGSVTMFWRNAERQPTSPVDPTAGILRLTDAAGKPLAVIVNYACHAVVLGPDNLQYSADWPGFMYRHLERKLGNGAVAFFIPGAGGDINPFDDKQPVTENGFAVAQKTGESLAEAVLAALARMPEPEAELELAVSQKIYDFQERFDTQKKLPVQATWLLLNKHTGILAVPAEAFVEHQINLRDRSPLEHTFLFGYAYGGDGKFAGYVPTIRAAMEGGYGANYATRLEPGAGERLVDEALIWFHERLGHLRDVPDLPR